MTDLRGQPRRIALNGDQEADGTQPIPLLTGIQAGWIIADKGYESNQALAFIQSHGLIRP